MGRQRGISRHADRLIRKASKSDIKLWNNGVSNHLMTVDEAIQIYGGHSKDFDKAIREIHFQNKGREGVQMTWRKEALREVTRVK